ncbi:MAG TPA: VWA domain-containing protein [Rubricoccaceae bacterium]|jgi:Ca-activated chloride channel family protein
MTFRSPVLLFLALALVPAAVALALYAARRRTEALRLFLGPRAAEQARRLAPLVRLRSIRAALTAMALGAFGVALAGPRLGATSRDAATESLDLVIALDVSNSMRTQDVAPSRLERATLEIERVVEARRGDRVGLVIFAGEAFLQCPLTTDRSAVRLFLESVDPEQIAIQGTDFSAALAVAREAFDAASADPATAERPRALLVVSDGEDHEGGLGEAAAALRESGVTVLALGVGTDAGGPVPDVQRGQAGGFKRDRAGQTVISTYKDGVLRDLAGRTGVVRVGEGGSAAGQVNERLAGLDRAVVAESRVEAAAERFQWPLALGVLLLIAERALARFGLPRRRLFRRVGRRAAPRPTAVPPTLSPAAAPDTPA